MITILAKRKNKEEREDKRPMKDMDNQQLWIKESLVDNKERVGCGWKWGTDLFQSSSGGQGTELIAAKKI